MSKISKILVLCSLLFLIALAFIIKTNNLLSIDEYVYNQVISFESNNFTKIVKTITNLGGVYFLTFLTILFIVIYRKKIYGLLIPVNIINVVIINNLLKIIFQRPRPAFYHIVEEGGYSFPSGHAMAAIGFYGFLIFMINRSKLDKKIKVFLTVTLSFLIIIIGISRVYLGVHYFTDIVAGFLCGFIYLLLFTNFIKKYLKHE